MGRARDIASAVGNETADYGREQGRALKKSGKWFLLGIAAAVLAGLAYGALGSTVVAAVIGVPALVLLFVGLWKFADAGGDTSAISAGPAAN